MACWYAPLNAECMQDWKRWATEGRPEGGKHKKEFQYLDTFGALGDLTGDAPLIEHLREAASAVSASGRKTPVLIGSGLDASNAKRLLADCDGAIVGTALMRDKAVDPELVSNLMQSFGS